MQFIGDDDEIPIWNGDKLWKCNLLTMVMKFQCGIETNYGNAMRDAFVMKFHRGKEAIAGIAIKPKSMMQFQWETDQYSTALNIQKPALNPDCGKRKC